ARNMRREPRVSLCIDDERPPFQFVIVEGAAELAADDPEMLRWATSIGGRYMGEEQAEAFGRRNAVPGELLVRVTPTKVLAYTDIAD
ncbi:MAG: PPOX class F420-dependent enzyme, partial [Rubrobacter sp.]|nr:PPOX class F420-dependent enzyme [Rubrobacter sp.]